MAFASELDSIFSLGDDLVKDSSDNDNRNQLPELSAVVEDNAKVNELDMKLKAKYADSLTVLCLAGHRLNRHLRRRQTLGLKNRELEELKERIRQLEEQEQNALGKPADEDDQSDLESEESVDDQYNEDDHQDYNHNHSYSSNHDRDHERPEQAETMTASIGLQAR